MTIFPTFASLSSAAPVGLFYAFPLCTRIGLKSQQWAAGFIRRLLNPALADGGQLSARNLLSISRWRKAGGVF
jgi:hypothetical protein